MPVNALRKSGARMSLQEALERVQKLKRLTQSSNEHEAALAALRLKTFDVDAARAPRFEETTTESAPIKEEPTEEQTIPVLDNLPEVPYETLDELEVHQPTNKKTVNWDELHEALLKKARVLRADAVANIQLKGTVDKKVLGGTAIRYLTSQDLFEIDQAYTEKNLEEILEMEAKERRDENFAPPID